MMILYKKGRIKVKTNTKPRTHPITYIFYFLNTTQETKQNQPQTIANAVFVNSENSAKSRTKDQIQIIINKNKYNINTPKNTQYTHQNKYIQR